MGNPPLVNTFSCDVSASIHHLVSNIYGIVLGWIMQSNTNSNSNSNSNVKKYKTEFHLQDRTRDVSNFCQLLKVHGKHERFFFSLFEYTCLCWFYFKTWIVNFKYIYPQQ